MATGIFTGVNGVSRKVTNIYTGVSNFIKRTLPKGYTQVEYIESNGTQYINTNFIPNQDTKVSIDIQFSTTPTAYSAIFGARNSTNSEFFCYYRYDDEGYSWRYANGNSHSINGALLISKNATTRTSIAIDRTDMRIDNTITSAAAGTVTPGYSMYLFAVNNANSKQYPSAIKLYSCKIYDNNIIVRDFIPCYNTENVAGLYDMINGIFYTDATGTGFSTGIKIGSLPEGYTQLQYIQSSGTQAIDTGFKPNQDTRVVMKASITALTSNPQFFFGARGGSSESYANPYNIFKRNSSTLIVDYGAATRQTVSYTSTTNTIYDIDKNKNICTINGTTITSTENTFQTLHNLALFASNDGGTMAYFDYIKLYSCQIYDNGTLIRNFIPCKNSSNIIGLYDTVNDVFYTNVGTGNFTSAELTEGVSRKIVSGYRGVNGVARQFYSSGVKWIKYNCTRQETYEYTQQSASGTGQLTLEYYGNAKRCYSQWGFDSDSGFYYTGTDSAMPSGDGTNVLGMYKVTNTGSYTSYYNTMVRLTSVASMQEAVEGLGVYDYTYNYTIVSKCTRTTISTEYVQGTTNYGEILVEEGQLPEEGALIEGSASGNYCILYISGIYYYYVKA